MTRPGIYRHYKGGMYRVLFTAYNSTNHEASSDYPYVVYVVYISLDPGEHCGQINVREEEEFNEWLEFQPGQRRRQRFEEQG